MSRRRFFASIGAGTVSAWLAQSRWTWPKPPRTTAPPGGKSVEQFLDRCSACGTCVSICPTKVLVPAGRENSWPGLGKARMDYERGYCSYECNACLAVCPSGAISYFPVETKKRIRVGQSRLKKELCIPYVREKDCAACQEQCPTGAIVMQKHKSVYAPVIEKDYCIGCGSCQYACPVKPDKAIVVDPVDVHSFAFNPVRRREGARRLSSEPAGGFPF